MGIINSKQPRSKRKIAFSIIIAAIIIINIIAGALIFLDIQVIKSPEMTIEIVLVEINSNEAIVQTTLSITNPNQFGLIIKNLDTITKTNNGTEIMRMTIKGGEIKSNNNKTYTSTNHITFDGEIPETLTTKLTGTVGLTFLGIITKTIPITVNLITSFSDVIKSIAIPIVHVKGNFGEMSSEGIDFTTEIDIENPNSFDINIDDLSIVLETEAGKIVGNFLLEGDSISGESSKKLNGGGQILIETLNAKTLYINLKASAGVLIAGISKSTEFSIGTEIEIPHLEDIFSTDLATEAFIYTDTKLTRKGFLKWGFTSDMTLEMRNQNKIGLIVQDIIFSVYRVENGEETLVGDCTANDTVVGPGNTTYISAQVYLPFRSILIKPRILPRLPEGFLILIRANITIQGLDQSFLIGVSGYQDLHVFK